MWRTRFYALAQSVLHRHPKLGNWVRKSHLFRTLVRFLFNFKRTYRDRPYLTRIILPTLASAKLRRVLFVGCKSYTAQYGKQLTRAGIEYWTTDIDPEAAIWGEKDRHIICSIVNIDDFCVGESFDAVLLNGVFGHGVDEKSAMNRAVKAIASILRPNGILLIGWNSQKHHPDPVKLEAATMYFRHECVLSLPSRKTFPDIDHVYDWLVKANVTEANGTA
jgi:SAM-dependent methyltransferase